MGDHWEDEIIEAIRHSDFVAIILSQVSARKRGFIQRGDFGSPFGNISGCRTELPTFSQ